MAAPALAQGCGSARALRGRQAHLSGQSAELIVLECYRRRGYREVERRWRSAAGEIDLIFQHGNKVIFVEVKSAKTHDQAAQRLSLRQLRRIEASGAIYLDTLPTGSLTECQVDLALVDGIGAVSIIENASQF